MANGITLKQVEEAVRTWPVTDQFRLVQDIIGQLRKQTIEDEALDRLCQDVFSDVTSEERAETEAFEKAGLEVLSKE
jgi:hypothetical protein